MKVSLSLLNLLVRRLKLGETSPGSPVPPRPGAPDPQAESLAATPLFPLEPVRLKWDPAGPQRRVPGPGQQGQVSTHSSSTAGPQEGPWSLQLVGATALGHGLSARPSPQAPGETHRGLARLFTPPWGSTRATASPAGAASACTLLCVRKLGAGQGRQACYKGGAGRGPRTCYKGGAGTGRGTCAAFLRMTQSSPLGEGALGNHNLKSQGVLAFLVASLSSNLRLYNLKPFML